MDGYSAALLATGVLAAAAFGYALVCGLPLRLFLAGILIGALVPLAWVGTGFVLLDEFDPIGMESQINDLLPWNYVK